MKVRSIIIFLIFHPLNMFGQLTTDTSSLHKLNADTVIPHAASVYIKSPDAVFQSDLNTLLAQNKFISLKQNPVFFITKKREVHGKEFLFYLLSGIILVFSLFRVFYSKYFNNIFRVFFNTSLRQNQLTDLLLQARLPSLIFNIFFSIATGLYLWLLLTHYYNLQNEHITKALIFCIIGISVIYVIKFCVLKFIGWITGMSVPINTYIFVIFLINKIIGITLIPIIVFLAFSPGMFFHATVILSVLVLGSFFLIRFFRSYSLLQHQIKLSRLHFLLYIISLEVLPLLVIYKLAASFFLRNDIG